MKKKIGAERVFGKYGQVVQSIVSLTKSLGKNLLSLTILITLIAVIVFAKILLEAFALQKLFTIFWQKIPDFFCIQLFKTNDVVS